MADVKWVKLSTDIFNNRKIRQIERMPDGYAYITAWVKLICLAGTVNDRGSIYLTRTMPYTVQMLATELAMDDELLSSALEIFARFGMIEVAKNGVIRLVNWEEYQNSDKLEIIREQSRERMAKKRIKDTEKASQERNGSVTDALQERNKSVTEASQERNGSVTVTQCYATEEEREEEGEEESLSISLARASREAQKNDEDAKEKCEENKKTALDKERRKQKLLGGTLGKGVVLISDEQLDDLLDKLSVDEFEHYVEAVAKCELNGKHFRSTHYQAILKMAAQDRKKEGE